MGLRDGNTISEFLVQLKEYLATKTLGVNVAFEQSEGNVATKELAMEDQTPNINVIRSVWRRIKKGRIRNLEIRELEPTKDVKGGRGGVTDQSNRITSGPDATGK